jgi:energy-coupling factor transporter ATP-binding protein EcfA2
MVAWMMTSMVCRFYLVWHHIGDGYLTFRFIELAANRQLYNMILNLDCDVVSKSDPSAFHTLPFPFCGSSLPYESFDLEPDPSGHPFIYTFQYMGREIFRELWKILFNFKKAPCATKLFFHGTSGYGKSHLLAALAVCLISYDERVVYLPDCRAMMTDFLKYFKTALCLAFADNADTQELIWGFHTEEDIANFLERVGRRKLYFIVDQVSALDTDPKNFDFFTNEQKEHAKKWLDLFAHDQYQILCAKSSNRIPRYLEKMHDTIELGVAGGFTEVSYLKDNSPHEGAIITFAV